MGKKNGEGGGGKVKVSRGRGRRIKCGVELYCNFWTQERRKGQKRCCGPRRFQRTLDSATKKGGKRGTRAEVAWED